MKRREFITLLGGAAAWPRVARAQPTPRRPVVAFVHAVIPPAEMAGSNPISPLARAFVHGLHDLGWIEGKTVVIERRRRRETRNAHPPFSPSSSLAASM
jgi:putative ABC transport system substrate-binding protein